MVEKSVILWRIKISRAFPRLLATELCRGPSNDFEIKIRVKKWEKQILLQLPMWVNYDISPLSRVKLKNLTTRLAACG